MLGDSQSLEETTPFAPPRSPGDQCLYIFVNVYVVVDSFSSLASLQLFSQCKYLNIFKTNICVLSLKIC